MEALVEMVPWVVVGC